MARSRRSRASSTPRLLAASISTTSSDVRPAQIRSQLSHTPQGSPSAPRLGQLSAMASTRASVVFPTPRGPQNRYACATRFRCTAERSVLLTCSCVATSENVFGRYVRASAVRDNGLPRAGVLPVHLVVEYSRCGKGVQRRGADTKSRAPARLMVGVPVTPVPEVRAPAPALHAAPL